METQISEEDLLSGIELLPASQPGTPIVVPIQDYSLPSDLDDSISPVKMSPSKVSGSYHLASSIQQVQKRLHDSLASSLRKEVQIKSHIEASPGEILKVNSKPVHKSPQKSYTSLMAKQAFLSMPNVESGKGHENVLEPTKISCVVSEGPNLCPSNQFPANLSPIKQDLSSGDMKEDVCDKSVEQDELTLNDAHTKKLLDFMKKLEHGSEIQKTSAQQLADLSALLKSSVSDTQTTGNAIDKNEKYHANNTESEVSKKGKEKTGLKKGRASEKSKPVSKTTTTEKSAMGKNTKTSGKSATTKTVQFKAPTRLEATRTNAKSVSQASAKERKAAENLTQRIDKGKSKSRKSAAVEPPIAQEEPPSKAVSEMMSVRNHLQTMLSLHKVDALALDSSAPDINDTANDTKEDTFRSTDTATLLRTQLTDLMPPISPPKPLGDSYTSDMFSILKAGKTSAPESARSSIDSSLTAENGILRDSLEKERYRRKHCEKQIQKLQKKMLEIQQELAVANSTERKKDLMIEQLDKTLAKVVDGWKEHETKLGCTIQELTQEKERHKEDTVKLKEMVVNLENELAKVLEELVEEKERISQAEENEKAMKQNYHARTEEISQVIDQKNETINRIQAKNDELINERNQWKEEVEKQQQHFICEKKDFIKKEEEWEEAIIEMEKTHKWELEQEKTSVETERNRNSDIQGTLATTLQETRRLEDLIEAQRRELESMRTQASLAETRHTAAIRKLEAEHKIDAERQITEKMSRVHEEAQKNENSIRETHKKQVLEFIESHKREIEAQCQRYEDELQKRDASMKKKIADMERQYDEKLRSKGDNVRHVMMSKMQNLLQAHYNETLQVVGTATGGTPQRDLTNPTSSLRRTGDVTTFSNFDNAAADQSTFPDMLYSLRNSQMSVYPSAPSFTQESGPAALQRTLTSDPRTFAPVSNFSNARYQQSNEHYNTQTNGFVPLQTATRDAAHALEVMDDEADGLANLSLISSISHGTIASSVQQGFQSQQEAVVTAAQLLAASRSEMEHATNFPVSVVAQANAPSRLALSEDKPTPLKNPNSDTRDLQLQRYIHMLLERPPGDPLNASKMSEKEVQHPHKEEENKENHTMSGSTQPPPTSHALLQLFHQNAQASPDLLPVKQVNSGITVRPAALSVNKSPGFRVPKAKNMPQASKRPKQNVRFAQQVETTVAAVPLENAAPIQITPAPTGVFSPAQMGEISRMLGLYTTSDTPTGETKIAAEQLLNYLRDQQAPVVVKIFDRFYNLLLSIEQSSVQPSVTSSPMNSRKQQNKQQQQVSAFRETSGGKGGLIPNSSPTKPLPAWR